jgi:hypothetical protein
MKKQLLLPAATPGFTKLLFCFFTLLFFSFQSYSQTVTGKVTDGNGNGVSGVTVAVKGSSTATATNAAGQYSITAASNAVLTISSVGWWPHYC